MQSLAGTISSGAPGVQARQGRAAVLVVRAQKQERAGAVSSVKAALRKGELARSAAALALGNILLSLPAHAEAGKIFDFNLTLPIMAAEFLALMVFLDKFWFGPVGKVLDKRDALIRNLLADSKDNKSEIEALQKQAEEVVARARQDAQKDIQAAQKKAEEESQAKLAEVKERIDKEIEEALATLETEKSEALKNLDQQVDRLAADVLARVLPKGVSL